MPRLGVETTSRSAPPASGNFTTTDRAFLVGLTDQGLANTSVEVNSIGEFESAFGPRSTTNQTLYDSLDVAFREGLGSAYVSRVVGPTPVDASVKLYDSVGAETLTVTAKYPGSYANGYTVVVATESSNFAITIKNALNEILEKKTGIASPTAAAALTWSTVTVTRTGTGNNPVPQELTSPAEVVAEAPSAGGSLSKSTTYFWKIVAEDDTGATLPSAEVTEKTGSGTELTVKLKWKAVSGALKYKIYRSTTTGKEVEYVTTTENKYSDAGGGKEEVGKEVPTSNTTNATLANGTDNRAAITAGAETTKAYEAALKGFRGALGSGQVAAPGQANLEVWTVLTTHANTSNRVAFYDLGGEKTEAEYKSALTEIAALANVSEGGAFVGNLKAPGITAGTERTIPASAVACALAARGDETGSPNVAPCGLDYPLVYCTGTDSDLPGLERETLFNLGGNSFHFEYGVLSLYGWQTPASTSEVYNELNHSRTRMAIRAQAKLIGAHYQFENIDGRGALFSAFRTTLNSMLNELWKADALFGFEPAEAYVVNVGPTVNTPTTIAKQELKAIVEVRYSNYVSFVQIELVSVPTNQIV
jgi:hypothetical protein